MNIQDWVVVVVTVVVAVVVFRIKETAATIVDQERINHPDMVLLLLMICLANAVISVKIIATSVTCTMQEISVDLRGVVTDVINVTRGVLVVRETLAEESTSLVDMETGIKVDTRDRLPIVKIVVLILVVKEVATMVTGTTSTGAVIAAWVVMVVVGGVGVVVVIHAGTSMTLVISEGIHNHLPVEMMGLTVVNIGPIVATHVTMTSLRVPMIAITTAGRIITALGMMIVVVATLQRVLLVMISQEVAWVRRCQILP